MPENTFFDLVMHQGSTNKRPSNFFELEVCKLHFCSTRSTFDEEGKKDGGFGVSGFRGVGVSGFAFRKILKNFYVLGVWGFAFRKICRDHAL